MKIKKLKDLSPTAKVYLKNSYLFRLHLHQKKGFIETLQDLLVKWCPEPESIIRGRFIREELDYQTLQKMKEMKYAAARRVRMFEKKLSINQKQNLADDIDNFLQKFKMGKEWFFPIKILLITGFFSPPSMNFALSVGEGAAHEKRIRLELNPDTSIDDIKMHWSMIRKFQKELYPNFKKVNLTEKKFTHLGLASKDLAIRSRTEPTQIDMTTLKKYRVHDLDLVGLLWPDTEDISADADKKRKNNLRQIRRRYKKFA